MMKRVSALVVCLFVAGLLSAVPIVNAAETHCEINLLFETHTKYFSVSWEPEKGLFFYEMRAYVKGTGTGTSTTDYVIYDVFLDTATPTGLISKTYDREHQVQTNWGVFGWESAISCWNLFYQSGWFQGYFETYTYSTTFPEKDEDFQVLMLLTDQFDSQKYYRGLLVWSGYGAVWDYYLPSKLVLNSSIYTMNDVRIYLDGLETSNPIWTDMTAHLIVVDRETNDTLYSNPTENWKYQIVVSINSTKLINNADHRTYWAFANSTAVDNQATTNITEIYEYEDISNTSLDYTHTNWNSSAQNLTFSNLQWMEDYSHTESSYPTNITVEQQQKPELQSNYTSWMNSTVFPRLYRRNISLDVATSVSNYQVKVELNQSNFNYSRVRSGGIDVRFRNSSENLLDHWISDWDPLGNSIIWVEVPNIGTDEIYMYYGDGGNYSGNGTNVFLLFDDFSGDSLDTSVWTETGSGTMIFSDGILEYSGSTGGDHAWGDVVKSDVDFDVGVVMHTRRYWEHEGGNWAGMGYGARSYPGFMDTISEVDPHPTDARTQFWVDDGSTRDMSGLPGLWTDGWGELVITRRSGAVDVQLTSDDGSPDYSWTYTASIPTGNQTYYFGGDYRFASLSFDIKIDYVFARVYDASKPNATVGSEEVFDYSSVNSTLSVCVQYSNEIVVDGSASVNISFFDNSSYISGDLVEFWNGSYNYLNVSLGYAVGWLNPSIGGTFYFNVSVNMIDGSYVNSSHDYWVRKHQSILMLSYNQVYSQNSSYNVTFSLFDENGVQFSNATDLQKNLTSWSGQWSESESTGWTAFWVNYTGNDSYCWANWNTSYEILPILRGILPDDVNLQVNSSSVGNDYEILFSAFLQNQTDFLISWSAGNLTYDLVVNLSLGRGWTTTQQAILDNENFSVWVNAYSSVYTNQTGNYYVLWQDIQGLNLAYENISLNGTEITYDPPTYPREMYISSYDQDGLGIPIEFFKFYLNGTRFIPPLAIAPSYYFNLTIKSFFNQTVYSQVLEFTREWNIFITLYDYYFSNCEDETTIWEIDYLESNITKNYTLAPYSFVGIKLLAGNYTVIVYNSSTNAVLHNTTFELTSFNFTSYGEGYYYDDEFLRQLLEQGYGSMLDWTDLGVIGRLLKLDLVNYLQEHITIRIEMQYGSQIEGNYFLARGQSQSIVLASGYYEIVAFTTDGEMFYNQTQWIYSDKYLIFELDVGDGNGFPYWTILGIPAAIVIVVIVQRRTRKRVQFIEVRKEPMMEEKT